MEPLTTPLNSLSAPFLGSVPFHTCLCNTLHLPQSPSVFLAPLPWPIVETRRCSLTARAVETDLSCSPSPSKARMTS